MNLIEPMMLAGAVLGAAVGATLGFSAGALWGLGGLVAGVVLGALAGPCLFMFLALLFVTLRYGLGEDEGLP